MVETSFKEAFSEEWVKQNVRDHLNELVIMRQVIPWQKVIERLARFYREGKGRTGKSLRMMVALLVIGKLRELSDAGVVKQVKENRYIQYFCNVPDTGLLTFLNPSTLCTFRKRLGVEGTAIVERQIFDLLVRAGAIQNDAQLMDSTVLENDIIYPTDVLLVYRALKKIRQFAERNKIPFWWDAEHVKKRWRAYNLAKKNEKYAYLWEFYLLFTSALKLFQIHVETIPVADRQNEKDQSLCELLKLLEVQTREKILGEKHIENRIVSLDNVDARPIKKGKSYPACEFGTTLQLSFNRQGFMVTAENFVGVPGDKTLYPSTLELYRERLKGYPDKAITDLGYRSSNNFKASKGKVQYVFMGRSEDVPEEVQDYCRRARSATEGFIAVAKNCRGFGRSLYRNLDGDKIWTRLCQIAYNLQKLVQLYEKEALDEECLIKLGLSPA